MMTRKDYVAVSKILRNYKHEMEAEAYSNLCNDFADYMEEDNPRFLDLKFLEACGVESLVPPAPPVPASAHAAASFPI
jgi:hypothetical protein